jgi:hypothetical protein
MVSSSGAETGRGVLSVEGPRLLMDKQPFGFRGLSFFNAVFNDCFNHDHESRQAWVAKFQAYGVTALRVWCQWDFAPPHVFADVGPQRCVFKDDGELSSGHADQLCAVAEETAQRGMALEVTLFSQEKRPNLPISALEKAAKNVSQLLVPYRNVLLQIWNECDYETERLYETIKAADPHRLVTSSPGFSDVLGSDEHNAMLEVLTPHTVRQPPARFWVDAPRQVKQLLDMFAKPVIDDEPARAGLVTFGGIVGGTTPSQHIAHMEATEVAGGYYTYHHDMFQGGYGDPATPADGIPDPEFSRFHLQVFEALASKAFPIIRPVVPSSQEGDKSRRKD